MDKRNLVWDFVKVSREHRKVVEKRICSLGIHPSQHHFLMYLAQNGACTQNSIAEAMEISAATVTVSLKKLEKGGYIERRISQSDSRSNLIALTQKGEDVVAKSREMFEQVDKEMFASITEEEQLCLHQLMERVVNNLKSIED